MLLPLDGGKRDWAKLAPELLPIFGAGSILRLGVPLLKLGWLEYNLLLGEGIQELEL